MKYFLSLCCIIKDEDNIEEFITHHRILGVEHFYIYDNESKIPLKERLDKKYFKDICTIYDFPGKAKQLEAYNNCVNKVKNITKWLIIIDGDEFILPKKCFSLRDFLKDYENYHGIGINWVMFGSSFHNEKQDGFLIDKYRYCEGSQNQHIKPIIKPNYVKLPITNMHYIETIDKTKNVDAHKRIINGPFNTNPTIDKIQINHYWGKSYQDMEEKIKRGRAPTTKKREMPKNYHSLNNKKKCNLIYDKYICHLIKMFEKMNEL
tara:strand:+ start:551 stop:1339 length:789 start_codon:yes stop_codon:yes gene_type:complete